MAANKIGAIDFLLEGSMTFIVTSCRAFLRQTDALKVGPGMVLRLLAEL